MWEIWFRKLNDFVDDIIYGQMTMILYLYCTVVKSLWRWQCWWSCFWQRCDTDFLDVTIATEATICLKIFFDVMVFHDFHQRSKDAMFASDCSSLIMLQWMVWNSTHNNQNIHESCSWHTLPCSWHICTLLSYNRRTRSDGWPLVVLYYWLLSKDG